MTDSQFSPPDTTGHGSRWRIIPAALLVLFGWLMVVGSLLLLAMFVAGFGPLESPMSSPLQYTIGLLLMTAVGLLWALSGRCWWREQWCAAIVSTLVSYGLGVYAAYLAWPQMGS